MPVLGEIRKASEVGYKDRSSKCIWAACIICGKERWVYLRKGKPRWAKCIKCGHAASGSGGGYRYDKGYKTMNEGYIKVRLQPDNPYYSMCSSNSSYVFEHRLIMAKYLGRCLEPWEVVHHKNRIKTDNHPENLEVLPSQTDHWVRTYYDNELAKKDAQIEFLGQEIARLQEEIDKLNKMASLFNKEKVY